MALLKILALLCFFCLLNFIYIKLSSYRSSLIKAMFLVITKISETTFMMYLFNKWYTINLKADIGRILCQEQNMGALLFFYIPAVIKVMQFFII